MEYKCFEKVTDQGDIYKYGKSPTDGMSLKDDNLRLNICSAYILWVMKFNEGINSIGDFGCGNGGLIELLKQKLPNIDIYGYDFCIGNVQDAKKRGLNVELKDITKDEIRYPDLIIIAEFLEHLENPHDILQKIPNGVFVVATVPNYENIQNHAHCHLWAWDEDGFFEMFRKYGFEILQKGNLQKSQIVVAKKINIGA